MTEPVLPEDLMSVDASADLQTVLAAWQTATTRLEKTHGTLRAEVRRLTDELEVKNRELARKNRLADLGQIASHVAHEVRNHLVPVALYLSLLRRRLANDSSSLDILSKVDAGITALDATVYDLLHFTAQRDPQLRPVAVGELIDEVYASLSLQFSAQSIRLTLDVPADHVVLADRDMLRRGVMNLMLNALDAMPDGGELVVTSCQSRELFELEIADSGPGFSEEAMRRAFEPFYTTKSGGTGLGLAIVCRIAEVHGGRLIVQNCPDGGAALTIQIPRQVKEAAA